MIWLSSRHDLGTSLAAGRAEKTEERMLKKCALIAAVLLVVGPASARADWLFTPNIGVGFGGDTPSNDKLTYGASIGWMGAGVLGWEADLAYTPTFFENDTDNTSLLDTDNVTTAMANVIIGVPIGGQTGPGFRPYVAGGLGMLKTHVATSDQLFNITNNDFGFDLGAGVIGFATDHVGFRGDVRYYRSLQDPQPDNEFDFGVGKFDFWRGTVGLAFRW
jgi:opacity protein-like surface antigen